jgi:NAD(P)H-quinone oxidoreductase subunit 6
MNFFDNFQDTFFLLLSCLAIVSSLGVILLPNLVYSAFLLGGVLVCVAAIFLLLNADFIAAAQILLYVGAINVLILFAIMLVKSQVDASSEVGLGPSTSATNGFILTGCLSLFLVLGQSIVSTPWLTSPFVAVADSVSLIGRHIFSDFLLPFELVSILLLVALVGAIILARREQLAKMSTEIVNK